MTSYAIGSLVCGGKSSRMGTDKLTLRYGDVPQVERLSRLLAKACAATLVLCRREQEALVAPWFPCEALVFDPQGAEEGSTLGAIARAIAAGWERGRRGGECGTRNVIGNHRGGASVLVIGCDMPLLDETALTSLAHAHETRPAGIEVTCFLDAAGRSPEPLASVWTPSDELVGALEAAVAGGMRCPRRFLLSRGFHGVRATNPSWILNTNTPEDFALARALLRRDSRAMAAAGTETGPGAPRERTRATVDERTPTRTVEIRYFAQLREATGKASERYVTRAPDALSLWLEVQAARGLPLSPQLLRVALNDAFASWDAPLSEGDVVAFLPPVAGG